MSEREFAIVACLLLALVGLLIRGLLRTERNEVGLHDARPADGDVPLVDLPGVAGVANSIRPEIEAYQSCGPAPISPRKRSRATNHVLKGRVAVFSLFVGRDGQSWDDREIADAFNSLERMGRWLEREAIRWDVPLNLERIRTYCVADDPFEETVELTESLDPYENVLDERDADVKGVASASRAAAALGFDDFAALIARLDAFADHDATVWVVFLMRSGRSSAVTTDRFQFPGVGITLCYARETSFSEPLVGRPYNDPATLAHELLHLFGATDKYGTSLASFRSGSVTSRDVMRLDFDRLRLLRIDPLTAAEVGWTTDPRQPPRKKNARHQREVDAGRVGETD